MKWSGLRTVVVVLAVSVLSACSSSPRLSTEMQPGFNLSGHWRLDIGRSDATPDARSVVDEMDRRMLGRPGLRNPDEEIRDGAVFAFIGQDFPVLKAHTLEIEQQQDSMGIRYEPGGYRDISWGERTRGLWKITSGWDDNGDFVIHSDSEDIVAEERLVMLDDQSLQVRLRVRADGGDLDLIRTFVRGR
jgi:hypothetical protein